MASAAAAETSATRYSATRILMMRSIIRFLIGGALTGAATCARAEIPPFYSLGPRPAADVFAAGAMYFHAPLYAGSDEQHTIVVPSATAILVNGFFADPLSGIGWNASTDPRFEFGPRA